MSVPTRADHSRSDVLGHGTARTEPPPSNHRPAASEHDRAAVAARLAGAALVLATVLAAFGGWLAVLL